MSTSEIIIISIIISVCISGMLMSLGFSVRDKDIRKLKDELGETRARLNNLEEFTYHFCDDYKEHLRGHRY